MHELLLDLYACSSAPDRWPALLDRLCDHMQLRSAVVQLLEHEGDRSRPLWSMRDSYSLAHQREHDRVLNNDTNPRLRVVGGAGLAGRTIIDRDEELFPAGSAELEEIQRRRRALRFGANMGGVIQLGSGRILALVLHRSAEDDREMGEVEETQVRQLLPHVRQALELGDQLGAAALKADVLMDAGDRLGVGMVLCDGAGQVGWANPAARSILAASTAVREVAGRLRPVAPSDVVPFRALLDQAVGMPPDHPLQLTLGRADPETAVQVLAVGAQAALWFGDARAVVLLLCEPGRPLNLSPAAVAQLFGLSAAEARLTASLCDGLSLGDYARQRGISEGTARIQLKRALAKTGSPRQAELVRRVCASLAVCLSRPVQPPASGRQPARLAS